MLYGGGLDSEVFLGGFPSRSSFSKILDYYEYLNSGWNLNNTPGLSGSLLSFESFRTCGSQVPKVRVGMCFSSFCWVRFKDFSLPENKLISFTYFCGTKSSFNLQTMNYSALSLLMQLPNLSLLWSFYLFS